MAPRFLMMSFWCGKWPRCVTAAVAASPGTSPGSREISRDGERSFFWRRQSLQPVLWDLSCFCASPSRRATIHQTLIFLDGAGRRPCSGSTLSPNLTRLKSAFSTRLLFLLRDGMHIEPCQNRDGRASCPCAQHVSSMCARGVRSTVDTAAIGTGGFPPVAAGAAPPGTSEVSMHHRYRCTVHAQLTSAGPTRRRRPPTERDAMSIQWQGTAAGRDSHSVGPVANEYASVAAQRVHLSGAGRDHPAGYTRLKSISWAICRLMVCYYSAGPHVRPAPARPQARARYRGADRYLPKTARCLYWTAFLHQFGDAAAAPTL